MLPLFLMLLSFYKVTLAQDIFRGPTDAGEVPTWNNISCVGNSYSLELPLQQGWNPNEVTMQQLCAKTAYGGGPAGQNMGGFCRDIDPLGRFDDVVFDISAEAHVNPQLSNPRVRLGCRYRCFCNHEIPEAERSVQPKANELNPFTANHAHGIPRASVQTYELQLDFVNDFTTPREAKQGSLGNTYVRYVKVALIREGEHNGLEYPNPNEPYISQDPGNKITCDGSLPSFELPYPYSNADFYQGLQSLCAVQLDGGLFGANAGGYCYRSDDIGNNAGILWFSDEMTPRLDWTWDGGNFFASAAIRHHCFTHCRCANAQTTTNTTYLSPFWYFLSDHELSIRPNGQVDITPTGSSSTLRLSGQGTTLTVLPPQTNGSHSASGTCGADGKQFCPQPWPTSLLGPIPTAPPNASDVVRPGPNPGTNGNLTVCGNRCQGPQDCGAGDEEEACTCALPNGRDARALGLDPVAPVAVCLVLLRARFGGKGGLNPREVEEKALAPDVDGEGAPWRCLCNATFVHNKCCGSRDGRVWFH